MSSHFNFKQMRTIAVKAALKRLDVEKLKWLCTATNYN